MCSSVAPGRERFVQPRVQPSRVRCLGALGWAPGGRWHVGSGRHCANRTIPACARGSVRRGRSRWTSHNLCQDDRTSSGQGGERSRGLQRGGQLRPRRHCLADLAFWAAGARGRWCRPGRHQLAFCKRASMRCAACSMTVWNLPECCGVGLFGRRHLRLSGRATMPGAGARAAPGRSLPGRVPALTRPQPQGALSVHGWRQSRWLWGYLFLQCGRTSSATGFCKPLSTWAGARPGPRGVPGLEAPICVSMLHAFLAWCLQRAQGGVCILYAGQHVTARHSLTAEEATRRVG